MNQYLERLYSTIQDNIIFTEIELCKTCPTVCSRKQRWHWLLPEEAEKLKDKMQIENKFGAFFFKGGKCPLLKKSLCSIYENRPLDCRLSPLSLYFTDCKLFWIIDIQCPYFKRHGEKNAFWDKVNDFISKIEPYLTEKIVKDLTKISKAIHRFDPLIENKDFIKIRELNPRDRHPTGK